MISIFFPVLFDTIWIFIMNTRHFYTTNNILLKIAQLIKTKFLI